MTAVSLSNLPENAIDEILCRLPIRDAVRTSALSHFWRRRWETIPDLNLVHVDRGVGLSRSEIFHVLIHHSGCIRLLKIIEEGRCYDDAQWETGDLEDWLSTVSLRSASTLRTLDLTIFNQECDIGLIARCLPSLSSLHLDCYVSIPPHYHGFSALRDLYLCGFILGELSEFISSCPSLHRLTVHQLDEEEPVTIAIVAPNLRYLVLFGAKLKLFSVISAPLLETATIDCHGLVTTEEDGSNANSCNLMKVFGQMPSIKELRLRHLLLEFLGRSYVPETLPIMLGNLTDISLDINLESVEERLVTLCLLRSSPNLENLRLALRGPNYHDTALEPSHNIWKEHEHVDLFDNLKEVTLFDITCTKDEMDIIKFFLAKAKVLKKFAIHFYDDENVEVEAFVKEVFNSPKVSNQAEIMFVQFDCSPL